MHVVHTQLPAPFSAHYLYLTVTFPALRLLCFEHQDCRCRSGEVLGPHQGVSSNWQVKRMAAGEKDNLPVPSPVSPLSESGSR